MEVDEENIPLDDYIKDVMDEVIYHKISQSVKFLNEDDNKVRGFTDYDFAKLLHHYYNDRFVCVNITDNKWYEFQNHRWTNNDNGTTLRNIISEEFCDKFNDARVSLQEYNKTKNDKKL